MFFHKYLTPDLFQQMQDRSIPWPTVLESIGLRLRDLGLLWPSEHTCLGIWVCFLCARCSHGALQLQDGVLAIERRQQIAVEAASVRSRYRDELDGSILQYPASIEAFREQYPRQFAKAFANVQPFQCPLDERYLYRIKSQLPCRTSHSTMKPALRRGRSSLALPAPSARAPALARGASGALALSRRMEAYGDNYGFDGDEFELVNQDPTDPGFLPGLAVRRPQLRREPARRDPFGFSRPAATDAGSQSQPAGGPLHANENAQTFAQTIS